VWVRFLHGTDIFQDEGGEIANLKTYAKNAIVALSRNAPPSFMWGRVLRHQFLVMTFKDEPKFVYGHKLLDIYFSRKKKIFLTKYFLSKKKSRKINVFYTFVHVISYNYKI